MTDCPQSGRGQGHVSNFYILHLENFATASLPSISAINKIVDGLFVDYTYDGRARTSLLASIRWSTVTL